MGKTSNTLKELFECEEIKSKIIQTNHESEDKYYETSYYDKNPSSYYNKKHQCSCNLQKLESKDHNTYSYMIKNNKGVENLILKSSFLESQTPSISLSKDSEYEVEFKWCNNLFNNIIKDAELELDDYNFPKFDNQDLDIYHNFFKDTMKNFKIGGVNYLNGEWYKSLPKIPLYCYQPWFYSQSENHFFPLFGFESKLKHNYIFNLNIFDLLCVRIRNESENEWKILKKQEIIDLREIFEISSEKIMDPILHVNIEQLDEKIIEYFLKKKKIERYIHTFVNLSSSSSLSSFDKNNINLTECQILNYKFKKDKEILGIFWMLSNLESVKYNILSNYTDNIFYPEKGDFPIFKSILSYSDDIEKFNWDKNLIPMLDHYSNLNKNPINSGYYTYIFTNDINYNGCQSGNDLDIKNSHFEIYNKVINYKNSIILKLLCQQKLVFSFRKEEGKIKTEIF